MWSWLDGAVLGSRAGSADQRDRQLHLPGKDRPAPCLFAAGSVGVRQEKARKSDSWQRPSCSRVLIGGPQIVSTDHLLASALPRERRALRLDLGLRRVR